MNLTPYAYTTKSTNAQHTAAEYNTTNEKIKTTIEQLNLLTADDLAEKSSSPTNKYFTDARAISAPLTGLPASTSATNAIAATDTILGAFKKVMDYLMSLASQINVKSNKAATALSVTALVFTEDAVSGTIGTPQTGNITAVTAGAQLGVTVLLIHNSGTAPTFSSVFKKLSGSGNYVTGVNNFIYCQYINNTTVLYSINQIAV